MSVVAACALASRSSAATTISIRGENRKRVLLTTSFIYTSRKNLDRYTLTATGGGSSRRRTHGSVAVRLLRRISVASRVSVRRRHSLCLYFCIQCHTTSELQPITRKLQPG